MLTGQPAGIIDVGSNSVRLVVYAGAPRIPSVVFNEKVLAGLGEDLAETGALSEAAQQRALSALRRFRLLTGHMGVARTRVVATAAVRDASNGAAFLEEIRSVGFEPELLSGEEEAVLAGEGVLSAFPDADGLVGDLGGGSLELVDVAGGQVRRAASFPLGVLRVEQLLRDGEEALDGSLAQCLRRSGFAAAGEGRPFYMVGGSWRALARLEMRQSGYPLPIIHGYRMKPDRPARLQEAIQAVDGKVAREIALSTARLAMLPNANLLLAKLAGALRPSQLIVSSFGIREGLLFRDLDGQARVRDPLLEAAREAGRGLSRFAEHGDLLDAWIAPLFDDPPNRARLRLAACLLADVAWQAHPDYRAERGIEMALHGNWVGIGARGRVMLAQALYSNFGGTGRFADKDVASLCSKEELSRASLWGLAMRLGQRLSGGLAASLQRSRLECASGTLRLLLRKGDEALLGETVERRLKVLAAALGSRPETGTF